MSSKLKKKLIKIDWVHTHQNFVFDVISGRMKIKWLFLNKILRQEFTFHEKKNEILYLFLKKSAFILMINRLDN